jgi:hypothetical protein
VIESPNPAILLGNGVAFADHGTSSTETRTVTTTTARFIGSSAGSE